MPNKVTLKRPDGTLIDATPEEAGRLALLGYKPRTEAENVQRLGSEAENDYYSTPGQEVLTGVEGLASGATLGGSDYLLGELGTDVKERAATNPGIRMATETLGAMAPALLTDGASVEASGLAKASRLLPSELLSSAAESLSVGREGGMLKAMSKTAIEGAGFGGASTADHAYLSGDPITSEAIFHGLGWGAIIGGGLGAAGHGLSVAGEHLTESIEAAKAAKMVERVPEVPKGALNEAGGAAYRGFQGEIANLGDNLKSALSTADATLSRSSRKLVQLGGGTDAEGAAIGNPHLVLQRKAINDVAKKAMKAASAGNDSLATKHIAAYEEGVNQLSNRLGIAAAPNGATALKEMVQMKALQRELASFPKSVEEFATMSNPRAERIFASLDSAKKLSAYPELGKSVNEAASRFGEALGVDSSEGLRGIWKAAKTTYKAEGRLTASPKAEEKGPSLARKIAGYAIGGKAYVAARAAGLGHGLSYAAYRGAKNFVTAGKLAEELSATHVGTIGRIKQAAANYMPKVGAKIEATAGRVSPLAMTLTGQIDTSTKDPRQLAMNRVQEINQLGPTIQNTLYRAVEPLQATQPALAQGLHQIGLASFKALQQLAPKDPGAISALKPIWKPSDIHAAVLSRQLAVFHDPVGESEAMLATGKFDPIKIEALREIAPNTWQSLRLGLLERITDPEVNKKLSYREQIGLSTMLDIPIHTSMSPHYIATSQAMFAQRSQPLAANPRMGAGGGMPSPGDNPNATQAQKSTAR
jgi:hypothetical protein